MKTAYGDEGVRERLIIAGIKEIEQHGFNDFSLRRVASACQVSCAAPYRHFKNKDELVLAIIAYINSCWNMMAEQIEKIFFADEKKQLIELCTANVRFLIANPNYLSIMLPVQSGMTEEQKEEREKLWNRVSSVCAGYSRVSGKDISEFLLKALICGTAALLEGADAEKCQEGITIMRKEILSLID